MWPTEIQRIIQQFLVIGPNIEANGERFRRMDARANDVQRKLAHRNRHAARALVANTEN